MLKTVANAANQLVTVVELKLIQNLRKCHPEHQEMVFKLMESLAADYQAEQAKHKPALRVIGGGK